MITRFVRHTLVLASLFVAATSAALAGGFTFSTAQNLNFDTLGGTVYNISMDASVTVGSDYYAMSTLTVGNITLSDSSTGYGESGCYIQISGIRKIHGQWVADSVYTYEQNLNGSPNAGFQYNVPIPSIAAVSGYTNCNGYSNPFWCSISW
jgi:hypothetical protein